MGTHKIIEMKKMAKKTVKNIEGEVPSMESKAVPSKSDCRDKKCPFHADVTIRGRTFIGTVIAARMQGTVSVEWPRQHNVTKYERFEKRRSRVKAHNPACVNAKLGDRVRIAECRPLAKTVSFVVEEVLK